jgi:hypothetical protein
VVLLSSSLALMTRTAQLDNMQIGQRKLVALALAHLVGKACPAVLERVPDVCALWLVPLSETEESETGEYVRRPVGPQHRMLTCHPQCGRLSKRRGRRLRRRLLRRRRSPRGGLLRSTAPRAGEHREGARMGWRS